MKKVSYKTFLIADNLGYKGAKKEMNIVSWLWSNLVMVILAFSQFVIVQINKMNRIFIFSILFMFYNVAFSQVSLVNNQLSEVNWHTSTYSHWNPINSTPYGWPGGSVLTKTFTNYNGTGVDVTLTFSQWDWDSNTGCCDDAPNIYTNDGVLADASGDLDDHCKVYTTPPPHLYNGSLRWTSNNDNNGSSASGTVNGPRKLTISFSQPVYIGVLELGSISSDVNNAISGDTEQLFVTATKASGGTDFPDAQNYNTRDCSGYISGASAPIITNVSGGTYIRGTEPQSGGRYQHVELAYISDLISSIDIDFWTNIPGNTSVPTGNLDVGFGSVTMHNLIIQPVSTCSISATASPGTCNSTTNQYTLNGTVTFTNPPTTGTLTVSVSGGGSQVFNAPFTSPQSYSISGLTSDGVSHTVTAVFSDDAACTANTTYTAPASCSCSPSCLLTASFFQDVILGFDGSTYISEGQGTNATCTLDGTYDMAIGPDGNLYISSSLTNTVLKFDLTTVSCLGTFVSAGSGGLNNPRGLTFLANGDLLVNSHNSGQILRYNGITGAFIGIFSNGSDISPIASMSPHMNIKVGPDGAVWVADHTNNRILRFDATTGAFLSVFAQLPVGSGVRSFEFVGSTVLISRHNVDIVAAYNFNTGAYISDFADAGDGLDGPTGITYGPDGKVYIGSLNTNQIIVFNTSGVQLSIISVDSPKDILFKCGDCFAPTCSISALNATPGTCNSTNNQYTLTGDVSFSNPPATGTLTVSVSGGGSQTFNAPFTSPQSYSISGLTSDGVSHTVTAVFSDDAACTANTTYTAPASCVSPGCNCTDMIYLNDETRNEVHKFSVNAGTGAISEIGSPWLPASAGVTFPHGIAIDLNGFVYISHAPGVTTNLFAPWDNHFAGGKSYKLKSNGTVLNPDPAPDAVDFTEAPNEWGANYGSDNGYLFVPNNLNETVDAYDLCTGDYVGSMTVARTAGTPHDVMSWGFFVENGNWYWSNIGVNKSVYTGSTDISLYNAGATNNGIELFNHGIPPGAVNTLFFDDVAMGITKDIAGNFYIIRGHINGTGAARIRKYGPTGVFISEVFDGTNSGANTTNGVAGFFGARGIAYSKESGLLYVGSFENCVTVFDTNLVEQTALNIGNPTAGRPKGIGIITECCPNQTTMTETRNICYNGTPEKHFLQEVLSCGEGTITEGNWTEESNTSGGNITFNTCDLSVTVSGNNGCAVYRIQKTTPAGGNEQCGAFDISLTICASPAPSATVSGNQGTCTGSTPNDDATINITSATNADQAGISLGATYTGPAYNGAGTIDISSGSGSFTNLIHNTQYTVRLFNGSNDCYKDTTLTTPSIICNVCIASVNTPTTQCNNNGTPANSTDDWFSVTLTGSITNGSGNYVVKIGAYTSPVTASGTAISITGNGQGGNPLLQANGSSTYSVRIEDAIDSSCFTTVTAGPVQACSNCPDPNCFNVTKQIIR